MADKDTTDHSSSKAPETRQHADERAGNFSDMRLIPGGPHGAPVPQGMEALDRDTVPNGATDPSQMLYGNMPPGRVVD